MQALSDRYRAYQGHNAVGKTYMDHNMDFKQKGQSLDSSA